MKCNRCGSEWNTDVIFGDKVNCPFCKSPLKPADNSIKEILKWIVQDRGIEVFQNNSVINAMLSDLANHEEKDRKKIKTALFAGAGAEFYNIIKKQGTLNDIGKRQLINNMLDYGFSLDFCNFIIDIFAYSVEYEVTASNEEKAPIATINNNMTHGNLKRNSRGVLVTPEHCVQRNDNDSVTEGIKKNGVWDGPFKKTLKDGSYYEGTYINGNISGELTYVDNNGWSRVGVWNNGNWNGSCREEKANGIIVEGVMKDGVWDGPFKKTYRDGTYDCYAEGIYAHGKEIIFNIQENNKENVEKHCVEHNNDGSVTEGTKKNGIWEGQFKKTFKDGSYYEGTYINGCNDGKLTYVSGDGSTKIYGTWANGNWNGDFSKFQGNLYYRGTYVDGNISGELTCTNILDGSYIIGNWDNDNWNGKCREVQSNGTIMEGTMKNGVWDGSLKKINKNGKYDEGRYANGKLRDEQ